MSEATTQIMDEVQGEKRVSIWAKRGLLRKGHLKRVF